ncbi:MAG: universal stress protein [Opitutus sp.]
MKTILAAIDFSPVTQRVVTEALNLARAAHARVIILNVTTPQTLVKDYAELEAVLEAAEARPTFWTGEFPVPVRGDSLQIIGEPAEVILEHAASCSADFIVIGSHEHSTLFNLFIGSTAAAVIQRAPCPVMIVPAASQKEKKESAQPIRAKRSEAWSRPVARKTSVFQP